MTTYSTRTVSRECRQWIVPAAEPWGAASDEIGKAWSEAERAYREHHGLKEDDRVAGNALSFHVGDDSVIIQFETEEAVT